MSPDIEPSPGGSARALRGALIGCGYISPRHIRAWEAAPSAELIAVCDVDVDRARTTAKNSGITHAFTTVDELLNAVGDDLDFIDVCVPPELHLHVIDQVTARGLHVLCQKPLASSTDDSLAIADIVSSRNVIFAINEMWKWIPAYERVWDFVQDGILGEIQFVKFFGQSNLLLPRREDDGFDEVHDRPSATNRDALMPRFSSMPRLIVLEYGVHVLDMLREWFGEPEALRSTHSRINPDLAGEDSAFIELVYKHFRAEVALDWSMPGPETPDNIDGESLVIRCSNGMLTVIAGKWVEWHPNGQEVQRFRFPMDTRDAGFARSHQDFAAAVLARTEPASTVTGNLATQGLVMSCYESATSGEWIRNPAASLREGHADG